MWSELVLGINHIASITISRKL